MTILTGTTNENEFYSHHYLDAVLQNDLKEVVERWKLREDETGVKPPSKEIASLKADYFKLRNQLGKEKDPQERLSLQRHWFSSFFQALSYEFKRTYKVLDDEQLIPIVAEVSKSNGQPLLWVIEALADTEEAVDVLSLGLNQIQFDREVDEGLLEIDLEDLVSDYIFAQEEPPRWVILASIDQIVLLDRFKWNASRLLRFDLGEILSRQDTNTLQATAILLDREQNAAKLIGDRHELKTLALFAMTGFESNLH